MLDDSDAKIVRMIRGGDKSSFHRLVEHHTRSLHNLALGMVRDVELAKDLVQDALFLSYVHLGQLHDPAKYGSWVRGILKNTCRMWKRHAALQPAAFLLPSSDISGFADQTAASPEKVFMRKDLREVVEQLCLSLPQPFRTTSHLFYIEGLSCSDISRALGVQSSTIETRLFKARAYFRRWLTGHGISTDQQARFGRLLAFAREEFIMDALRLEISLQLIPLIQPAESSKSLLDLLKEIRLQLETEHAIRMPKIHIIDNQKLPAFSFSIFLQEQNIASGTLNDTKDMSALSDTFTRAILDHREAILSSS